MKDTVSVYEYEEYLTKKQRAVLRGIMRGTPLKTLARRRSVSPQAVLNMKNDIVGKLKPLMEATCS